MITCRKKVPSVSPSFGPMGPVVKKVSENKMSILSFQLIFMLSGLTVAYFMTYRYMPAILVSVFDGNNQITSSKVLTTTGTSVVKRTRQQTMPQNSEVKQEAVTAMNIAMDMEAQGKHDKALKLFQHALNLDPSHADILTAFGEFLEHHENDIAKAEQLYSKALLLNPEHSKALENRKRVLPLVEEIDQRMYNAIDKKLSLLYKVPNNHPGLRRQKREAYYQHIFHTNAIEGNTLTLAQTRSIVETGIAIGGKSLVEQQEVLGLDAALSYVNNTLLGRIGSITLEDILQIHKRVLGFVDPLEGGRLRQTQVFVADFVPAPPEDVPALMEDFINWLNTEEALSLHPVEYAALAHYKLVYIHPFYDGNGRTSRLLMNLILMQAGFPPVTIKVEDRARYYETLNEGNLGDLRAFIRFIAESTERTLDEFLLASVENAASVLPEISNWRPNKTKPSRVIYAEAEP
ncbi:protein adenylyltransferase FICD-like [Ruditapes philippinarum]|uniref:protein adenylyltransferase FICD-like n=1 Tax=Ruditapes philippinarum TaxID=129788 RepID=UPI00295BCD7A|nr:protein adenylyltransferase FICD-like [Ruditapes philippinarum]